MVLKDEPTVASRAAKRHGLLAGGPRANMWPTKLKRQRWTQKGRSYWSHGFKVRTFPPQPTEPFEAGPHWAGFFVSGFIRQHSDG